MLNRKSEIPIPKKSVKLLRDTRIQNKKVTTWTEEEHRLFLYGLQKFGKGDWKNISKYILQSKTPTQIASHAQKYFLRQSGANPRKRASIHDITLKDQSFPQHVQPYNTQQLNQMPQVKELPSLHFQRCQPDLLNLDWVQLHLQVLQEIKQEQKMQHLNPPKTNL